MYHQAHTTIKSKHALGAGGSNTVEGIAPARRAGADPNISTTEGVTPLLVAAGDGFHGNDAITVPAGRMPSVEYLVEVCKADVNAVDKKAGESTSILHSNSRALIWDVSAFLFYS